MSSRRIGQDAHLLHLRRSLLEAREARETLIRRALEGEGTAPPPGGALVFASTNVPGEDKDPEGVERLFLDSLARLQQALGIRPIARLVAEGCDAAGRFALVVFPRQAAEVKRAAVAVEQSSPASRLIDLDVYDSAGRQLDRASLGVTPRRCLLCDEPAAECMRTARHPIAELVAAARALLAAADER